MSKRRRSVAAGVGALLRAARRKIGLTQDMFALALGVKLSRYQKWERGAAEPRFTVTHWRRLYELNPQVFQALLTGSIESIPLPRPRRGRPPLRRSGVDCGEEDEVETWTNLDQRAKAAAGWEITA